MGRFLQADTVVPGAGNSQHLNRYTYTGNNPIKYSDPTGHCFDPITCGALVGAILGAGINLAIQYSEIASQQPQAEFLEVMKQVDVQEVLFAGAVGAVGGVIGAAIIPGVAGLAASAASKAATSALGANAGLLASGAADMAVTAGLTGATNVVQNTTLRQYRQHREGNDVTVHTAMADVVAYGQEDFKLGAGLGVVGRIGTGLLDAFIPPPPRGFSMTGNKPPSQINAAANQAVSSIRAAVTVGGQVITDPGVWDYLTSQ